MNQPAHVMDALPDFFKDVEIVGSAEHEVEKYKAQHAANMLTAAKTDVNVAAVASPVLLASQSVREAYQSNDFAKIKQMETDANNDLQSVYNNVSTKGKSAWTKVKSNDKTYYMAWSSTGSMWSYTDSITPITKDGKTTYQAIVQVGSYTQTGKIAGIHSYNLTLPTLLAESVVAYIVARAVSGIVAEGLGFLVANFALYLTQAAAEVGLESFAFFVSEAALATIASCLVFAVVFIGLLYLWNWLNRKYTIRLQVFNWDDKHDWNTDGQYMSNAKIAGKGNDFTFTIPKMVPPGGVVTPPGFDPVEALDAVCFYAVVVWENDNTFMEGCSMAVRMQRENSANGFMWAFDCPRFSDNKQAGSDGTSDPKSYLNNVHWNNSPRNFSVESTPDKTLVNFALDELSGASDNLYNAIININPKA